MCTYHSQLYLRGGSDDVRRVIALVVFEFAVLTAVLFLIYANHGAAPNYFVASLRFYHTEGGMLFRFPSALVNVLRQFRFFKIAERMRMALVLVGLAVYGTSEIDWSLSSGVKDLVAYTFSMGTVSGYPAERFASVEWQNTVMVLFCRW